ncbi:hypothetical protein PROFUN_00100 [Planoprotostelium fungivorum]|uniref:Crossover junction endonuclease MUS81 n=1 Tax=Planoprotostelium fungivorum TaxID=1890364 RepID=A0A2P6P0P3_9EUKA|nr:hypothetical protein PROFUN_00100 [Planoprotostelium fungivorum]
MDSHEKPDDESPSKRAKTVTPVVINLEDDDDDVLPPSLTSSSSPTIVKSSPPPLVQPIRRRIDFEAEGALSIDLTSMTDSELELNLSKVMEAHINGEQKLLEDILQEQQRRSVKRQFDDSFTQPTSNTSQSSRFSPPKASASPTLPQTPPPYSSPPLTSQSLLSSQFPFESQSPLSSQSQSQMSSPNHLAVVSPMVPPTISPRAVKNSPPFSSPRTSPSTTRLSPRSTTHSPVSPFSPSKPESRESVKKRMAEAKKYTSPQKHVSIPSPAEMTSYQDGNVEDMNPANQPLVGYLKELIEGVKRNPSAENHNGVVLALGKCIQSIRRQTRVITCAADVADLNGFGPRMTEFVAHYFGEEEVYEYEDGFQSVEEFWEKLPKNVPRKDPPCHLQLPLNFESQVRATKLLRAIEMILSGNILSQFEENSPPRETRNWATRLKCNVRSQEAEDKIYPCTITLNEGGYILVGSCRCRSSGSNYTSWCKHVTAIIYWNLDENSRKFVCDKAARSLIGILAMRHSVNRAVKRSRSSRIHSGVKASDDDPEAPPIDPNRLNAADFSMKFLLERHIPLMSDTSQKVEETRNERKDVPYVRNLRKCVFSDNTYLSLLSHLLQPHLHPCPQALIPFIHHITIAQPAIESAICSEELMYNPGENSKIIVPTSRVGDVISWALRKMDSADVKKIWDDCGRHFIGISKEFVKQFLGLHNVPISELRRLVNGRPWRLKLLVDSQERSPNIVERLRERLTHLHVIVERRLLKPGDFGWAIQCPTDGLHHYQLPLLVERKSYQDLISTERDYRGFHQVEQLEGRADSGTTVRYLLEGFHAKERISELSNKMTERNISLVTTDNLDGTLQMLVVWTTLQWREWNDTRAEVCLEQPDSSVNIG